MTNDDVFDRDTWMAVTTCKGTILGVDADASWQFFSAIRAATREAFDINLVPADVAARVEILRRACASARAAAIDLGEVVLALHPMPIDAPESVAQRSTHRPASRTA